MASRCSYSFASFNCKSVKRSVDSVRGLCRSCDIIALQETWLLPDEIPYLGTIDNGFGYTGTSAVDTSSGVLRGRPFGGVALLWKNSVFRQVSVLRSDSARICAIKLATSDRPVIVMSIYMPTNSLDNLPEFTDCLSAVSAIVDEYGIESVYMLGDFNSDIYGLFYSELSNYCVEQSWSCCDVDYLGIDSGTFTFISEAHGSCAWLDHCLVTQAAKQTIVNVYVDYDALWSDHFPLMIECNLYLLTPKVHANVACNNNNSMLWGVRGRQEVRKYTEECHKRLKQIDFPMEFVNCADFYGGDHGHRRVLDRIYSDIVSTLCDASSAGRGGHAVW